MIVGSVDTGVSRPAPAPSLFTKLPPSSGAAALSSKDTQPNKPVRLVLKVMQKGGIIYCEDEASHFYAECEPAEDSAFVFPPQGFLCSRISERMLRIRAGKCQHCFKAVPQTCLTQNSAMRLYRRLYRALNNSGTCTTAHEKIICLQCAGNNAQEPMSYLQELVRKGVLQVDITMTAKVRDHRHEAFDVSKTFRLGDSQKVMEQSLYNHCAALAKRYLLDGENAIDSVDPMFEEVDSDVDMKV